MSNKTSTPAVILAVIALLCSSIITVQARYGKYAFRDEFNRASGMPVDSSKWTAEIGGGGWGNEELQYYTNDIENAYHDGTGSLVIKTIKRICRFPLIAGMVSANTLRHG
jgi:hypothetical protein